MSTDNATRGLVLTSVDYGHRLAHTSADHGHHLAQASVDYGHRPAQTSGDHTRGLVRPRPTRRRFLQAAGLLGGAALAGRAPLAALAAQPAALAPCGAGEQDLLNVALTLERAATAF